MKTTSEFARDAHKWDDRELGASEGYVEVAPPYQMKIFNKSLLDFINSSKDLEGLCPQQNGQILGR